LNSQFGIRNSELQNREPCLVGLTGGLASGKSTVADLLRAHGIPVLDADLVVHDLYRPDAAGTRAVVEIFGPGILGSDGGVDRGALGGRVLRDGALRLALEGVIHPLVRTQIRRWIEGLGAVPVAVVEAALLVETGSYQAYDQLVVVWCRREQQLERARARGLEDDRVWGLLSAQKPLDDKREVADVVIDNSGARDDLEAEVDRAWTEVADLCTKRRQRSLA
jgi:dephospho-CoA kinase